jgi:hypothetical protein
MQPREIHRTLIQSRYKPWQIYLLGVGIVTNIGLALDIWVLEYALGVIERLAIGWRWLVILGLQGVSIGFAAEVLYEQDDRYAKSLSPKFGSKDRTLIVRVGLMTGVSGFVTLLVPQLLQSLTEYQVIQTVGAVTALGILLVNTSSSYWKARTEWPAIIGGGLLAIGPSIA